MEQVYNIVGMFTFWILATLVAGNVAYAIFMYARGFVRACKFVNWAWQNKVFKIKVTPWVIVRTVFQAWNEQTWFNKSDSITASNGSVYRV